jgi:hypothetical protein
MTETNYPYSKKQEAPLFLVSLKAHTPVLYKLKPYASTGISIKTLFSNWASPEKAKLPKKKKVLEKKLKNQMLLLQMITGGVENEEKIKQATKNNYEVLLKKYYSDKNLSTASEFDKAMNAARAKNSDAWKDPEEFWIKIFRSASHEPVGTGKNKVSIAGAPATVPSDLFLPVRPGLTICLEEGLVGKPKPLGIEPFEGSFMQVVDTRVLPIAHSKAKDKEFAGGGLLVGVIKWFGTSIGDVTKGSRTYEIFPIEELPLTHSMWIYPRKGPAGDTNSTILHSKREKMYLEENHPKGSRVRVHEDKIPETLLGVTFAGKKRNHPLSSTKSTTTKQWGLYPELIKESFFPRRKHPKPKEGIVCEVVGEPERNIANREYIIKVQSVKDTLKFFWISSFEVRKQAIKIGASLKSDLLEKVDSLISNALLGKVFEPHAPSEQVSLQGFNPFDWYRETIKKKVPLKRVDDIKESEKEAAAFGGDGQGAYFLSVRSRERAKDPLPKGQSVLWSEWSSDQSITITADALESVTGTSSALQKKCMAWLTDKLKERGYKVSGDSFEITIQMEAPMEIAVIKNSLFIDDQLDELRPFVGPSYDENGNLTNYPGERDIHIYNMFLAKKYFEGK